MLDSAMCFGLPHFERLELGSHGTVDMIFLLGSNPPRETISLPREAVDLSRFEVQQFEALCALQRLA
jgi:hypothetical protein